MYSGGEVAYHYDPMLAKLITWGKDRDEAIARMRDALDQFVVRGIQTNLAFLSALIAHEKYRTGNISTNTIAEEYPDGFDPTHVPSEDPTTFIAVIGSVVREYRDRAALIDGQLPGHRRKVPDDWVVVGKEHHPITVLPGEDCHTVHYNGETYIVCSDWEFGQHLFSGTINGEEVHVQVERDGQIYTLSRGGSQIDVLVMNPRAAELYKLMPVKEPPDTSGHVIAPMPGLIVSISVSEGEEVKAGDELAVLEAMKMENAMRAERNGVVGKINFKAGDSVEVDEIIMELE